MRRTRSTRRSSALGASAALLLAVVVATAGAQDAKPTPCSEIPGIKDPAGDQVAPTGFAAAATDSTDVLELFARHDAAKAAEAATLNFHVKNLALQVPSGFSSLTWQGIYRTPDDVQKFVRAVLDFSGNLSFEFGDFQDLEATNTSVYRGQTTGKAFEGADGVMQVVIPADRGGAAGTTIKEVFAETRVGRTLPNAVTTPSRGLASTLDTVPDDGATAAKSVTLTPCGAGAAPPPDGGGGPPTQPPPGGGGGVSDPPPGGSPPAAERALPVTLLTRSVKSKKVKRKLTVKLRSSERVTGLAAQLRKGKKVVGRGALSALEGTGRLSVKVKKLKRGSYVLDLAGNDAQGARRFASYKIRAR